MGDFKQNVPLFTSSDTYCIPSYMIYEIPWTNETLFFIKKYIPHFILCLLLVLRDRWRDIYSERWLLLISYLLPGARGCQPLHPFASRVVREVRDAFDRLHVPGSTLDYLNSVSIWPRGYHVVSFRLHTCWTWPDCPVALSPHCLQITTWQLVKAHGITRNEPKIHVICYIICWFEKIIQKTKFKKTNSI